MSEKKEPPKRIRSVALTSAALSYLVGPVLIGVFSGRWLDGRFGTEPLFLIVGLLAGIAGGVYGLVRLLQSHIGDDQE